MVYNGLLQFISRACRLQVGPNFGVRPAAGRSLYLRLMVEKMRAIVVYTKKYLRLYG